MPSLTTHSLSRLLGGSTRPEGVRQRFDLLMRLAPTLPLEEQRVVIHCVQELKDVRLQIIAIGVLASRVQESLRPLFVDLAIQRAWSAHSAEGDAALRSVRPFLAPAQWEEALGRLLPEEPEVERFRFMLVLSRGMQRGERFSFLERAILILERVPPEQRRSLDLTELAGEASGSLRFRVSPLIEALEPSPLRTRALVAWARTLRKHPREEAFARVLQEVRERGDTAHGRILEELAPLLPAPLLQEALGIARSRPAGQERARVMARVAVRLPATAGVAAFKEVFQELRQVLPPGRWEVLESILRHVPPALMGEAWELVLSEQNPPYSTLRMLVRHTPPGEQPQRWLQLVEHSRRWGTQEERWDWIAHLSRAVPAEQRPAVLQRLEEARVEEAREVSRAFTRADLSVIGKAASRSGGAPTGPILESAQPDPFPVPEAGDGLEALPEEERVSVLRQMVHRFGEDLEAREGTPERVVNLGFSEAADPERELSPEKPLQPATEYLFWCEVGAQRERSITDVLTPLSVEQLPENALITVALFGFEEELEITSERDTGQLRLWSNGDTTVEQHPTDFRAPSTPARLFFKVRTPARPGVYQLRCNLYHQTALLQSWLVRAEVMEVPRRKVGSLLATQDFVYSRVLEPDLLAQLPSPGLTMMLNGTENSSHLFIFGDDIKEGLSFTPTELKKQVDNARDRLAHASWGGPRPWDETKYQYLYDKGLNPDQLRQDLARCAIAGWRLFTTLTARFPSDKKEQLQKRLRSPDSLQLALKESSQAVVPLALVYDYPFDTNKYSIAEFKLCPDFLQALVKKSPLEKLDCFLSGCPHQHVEGTICPSGFWGFRHDLGITLSIPHLVEKPPTFIPYAPPVQVAVGVSMDTRFTLRDAHLQALRNRLTAAQWNSRNTRATIIELLKSSQPHLVYFYCHGGLDDYDMPYIKVGAPNESGITRDNLSGNLIAWKQSRPLVFINGCHTTALEPDVAQSLVAGFIEDAYASGVLGTEITVFEPTASAFAEHCFQRLFEGASVGRAVRDARRALLQQGNPLGLVYVPFVLPGLRFHPSPKATGVTQEMPMPVVS